MYLIVVSVILMNMQKKIRSSIKIKSSIKEETKCDKQRLRLEKLRRKGRTRVKTSKGN